MYALIHYLQLALAAYFALLSVVTVTMVLMAIESGWRRSRELRGDVGAALEVSPLAPSVSIIVPAYNEEATIVSCVESFLSLRYPRFEVIVVADGCKDETVGRMHQAFDLVAVPHAEDVPLPTKAITAVYRSRVMPNLTVIDKENGGKSDAINVGMNAAVNDLVAVVDADSLIEPDSLLKIVEPFAIEPDRVIAAGGSIRIANDGVFRDGMPVELGLPRKVIPRIQTVEYLRSFMLGRLPFARMSASVIISGAFGLFRRDLVLDVGGYDPTTIGEDAELSVRLQRRCREIGRPYHVAFVPDAICWTEAPESRRVLGRQRSRWNQGLCEFLWRHRNMVGNPRFGRIGMIGLPFYFLFEAIGPFAEIGAISIALAMMLLDLLNMELFILLTIGTVLLGQAQSVGALMVDALWFKRIHRLESMLRLAAESVLEMVWYRGLTLWWRLLGMTRWARGRHTWGNMERVGLKAGASEGVARRALGERRRQRIRALPESIAVAWAEMAATIAEGATAPLRPALPSPAADRGPRRHERDGIVRAAGERRPRRERPHTRPDSRTAAPRTRPARGARRGESWDGWDALDRLDCPAPNEPAPPLDHEFAEGLGPIGIFWEAPAPPLRCDPDARAKDRAGAGDRLVSVGSRAGARRGARERPPRARQAPGRR